MPTPEVVAAAESGARRSIGPAVLRALRHAACLVLAGGGLALYEHLRVGGHATASYASLAAAAGLAFAPLRDVARGFFKVEGRALHLVHAVGGLALVALPVTGVVSGTPVLTHAAMAPFAIMGAAQAVMHQNHPRNAKQAAALAAFATSLPEVAQFSSASALASPVNAQRAIAVLSDIIGKAEALGQTELDADPGFQSALSQVSTRMGGGLGLDAVDLALNHLASNPAAASAVPALRQRVEAARRAIAGKRTP